MLSEFQQKSKSFNDKLNINMKNIWMHEMITVISLPFCKSFFVEVLNELYVRNVKKILTEPTRRFPHTRLALSTPVTCNRVE
jgi:hypothetical protein